MNNKYIEKDKQIKNFKKGMKIFIGLTIIGSLISVGSILLYRNHQKFHMTQRAQSSLIKVETDAVKNNAKPLQVSTSILKHWDGLSSENKVLAADIVYSSVQNSTLYYNNAVLLMSGEIEYNKVGNDSLSAANNSAWVAGFVQDIENNSMTAYNLNKEKILVLPDFKELYEKYNKGASSELLDFLKIASEAQNFKIFTKNNANVKEADKAYSLIVNQSSVFKNKYPNSKYMTDLGSLARIYHDVALGFVQTNNLKLKSNGNYELNKEQLDGIKYIANNDKSSLKTEAMKFLSNVKNNEISSEYLKNGEALSAKTYGSSLFWQSDTDISNLVNDDGTSNIVKSNNQ